MNQANESERFVVDALCEVLKREKVSVDTHFFDDLGANSLLMARLCARLRKKSGWNAASMRDIYLHPTAMQLAAHLQRQAEAASRCEQPQLSTTRLRLRLSYMRRAQLRLLHLSTGSPFSGASRRA